MACSMSSSTTAILPVAEGRWCWTPLATPSESERCKVFEIGEVKSSPFDVIVIIGTMNRWN